MVYAARESRILKKNFPLVVDRQLTTSDTIGFSFYGFTQTQTVSVVRTPGP